MQQAETEPVMDRNTSQRAAVPTRAARQAKGANNSLQHESGCGSCAMLQFHSLHRRPMALQGASASVLLSPSGASASV